MALQIYNISKIIFISQGLVGTPHAYHHRNPAYHPSGRKDIPSKATGNGDELPLVGGNGSGPMSLPPQSNSMNAISDVPVVEQPQGNKRHTMFEPTG